MRIAVISTPVFRVPVAGYSGLEHLAWLIAKGLGAKGHHVYLIAPDGSQCPNVQMVHVGPERQVDEKTAYGKYWQLLTQVDVVIDHSWQKFSYLLKAEGKLTAPVLGVCHAPINTMYQSPPPVPKPCIVCISSDAANHYAALFSAESRTAHNGVDGKFYQPLNMPRSDRYLFLARFSTIKGPDLAIEACKRAGVGLDLIGDVSITNEPELLEKCRKMADGKQIRLVGPCHRGNTVWWYSQAKALLHPNQRFREPFGLAPVEALCCGCPVIAWKYGAMPETISPNDHGFLVNSLEEMVELLKTDAVSKIDRNRCREWGLEFSVEKMVDRYEWLCQDAITNGGW